MSANPTFRSIAGQHHITGLLSRAMARGTLPPTLLFAGPPGVGKWLTARSVAAAINCTAPVRADHLPFDACGACRSCDRVARGMHVDVHTLEPDDRISIKIDVVREVLERTGFRPFEGRRRAVLIREADALEPGAQNALLKSLEEPPPSCVFILTTAIAGALLPTVRSRCMRLGFGRLPTAHVAGVLTGLGLSAEEAATAAAMSDGSVGRALALRSADLRVLRELAVQLLERGASPAIAGRLQAAATIATEQPRKDRSREDVTLVLRFATSLLRDIELLNSGADARGLANAALAGDLRRIAPAFAGDRARRALAAVDRARMALGRNGGTKVVADWLAMQL